MSMPNRMPKKVRAANVATTDAAAREAIAALATELATNKTITELRHGALAACYAHVLAVLELNPKAFDGEMKDRRNRYPFACKIKELFGQYERCRSDITKFSAVITLAHTSKITVDGFVDWLRSGGGADTIYRNSTKPDPVNDNERTAEAVGALGSSPEVSVVSDREYPKGTYLAVIEADGAELNIIKMIPRDKRKIATMLRGLE